MRSIYESLDHYGAGDSRQVEQFSSGRCLHHWRLRGFAPSANDTPRCLPAKTAKELGKFLR
jgi:hypothetical protein